MRLRVRRQVRRVRRLLKHTQAAAQVGALLLLFVATFLGTGVLPPSLTYIAAEDSIVQSLPDAQKLVEQAKILYDTGKFSQTVIVLQQAVAASKATGDGLGSAMALSNLSLAYQQLGQWPQARQAIRKAIDSLQAPSLNLLQTEENNGTSNERAQILAQALDVQGRLQLLSGQAETALTTWRAAADIYAKIRDDAGLTRNKINSAQAMQALGLYRQAQKTLTQVQQLLQNQPDSLKATGLRSLGNVFRVVGDLKASQQVLEQSLDVAKRLQSAQAISDTLLSLGNTARTQQDPQAALKFYQQAAISAAPTTHIQAQLNQLSLLLETEQWKAAQVLWPQIQPSIANLPPSRTAVYARVNFAQSLMKLGASPSSIAQLLATAVQQAKSIDDRRAEAYALGNLGELYERTEQGRDALKLTQQALFIAQGIDASDIAYRWQWQLGRLLKNQGDIQGAIAAYTEAVNNLKFLRSDLVALNPEAQFDFRDEVEPVYRQLVDLLLHSVGNQQPSQENLASARNTIESLQLAELENFFRSACLDAKPEQVDLIVDKEDRQAAVIYPIILPNRLEIILKLPTQPQLRHYVTQISQTEVETILEELQQYLREPDRVNDVKNLSQKVYGWIIEPLKAELEKMAVRTLVFVLDGSLRNIPMAVLYDGKHKQYLIEKYAIALAPGLQLLEPQPLPRKQLTVLTGGVGEERIVEGREFPQLENVQSELAQIGSKVHKNEELFNQAFTKKNLQNQIDSTTFSVIHLATHGQFSSNPDQTFILTWNQLLKINDLDNLLRTSGQSRSSPIELLVLSACDTAAGDKRATLGLAGIAVRAGARSTLATLWAVDDRSTAELMSEFYRQLVSQAEPGNEVTKAEALRRAQLALWNNKSQDWKRPYFWASYVLVGNWL